MSDLSELLKPPNDEQKIVIRKALREDPDRLCSNVQLLETWISYQKHLPQNYDRRLLYAYIRGCKHDMEKAKRKIEIYFAVKSSQHDLYSQRVISLEGDLSPMEYGAMITLPEYTPEGYRVTVFKITKPDPETFSPLQIIRSGFIFGDFRAHLDNLVAGEVLILDQGEVTPAMASKTINSMLKRAVQITEDVYPSLIKQIHVITDKVFVEKMINVGKYFLKEKLRNRIRVHRTHTTLTDYIPLKCLPADYGGSQKSIEELNEQWKKMYVAQARFFEDLDKVRMTNGIPKKMIETYSEADNFGVEGSFRQLNID